MLVRMLRIEATGIGIGLKELSMALKGDEP